MSHVTCHVSHIMCHVANIHIYIILSTWPTNRRGGGGGVKNVDRYVEQHFFLLLYNRSLEKKVLVVKNNICMCTPPILRYFLWRFGKSCGFILAWNIKKYCTFTVWLCLSGPTLQICYMKNTLPHFRTPYPLINSCTSSPSKIWMNTNIYMGGLALMVTSPKNWEFLPSFMSTLLIIQPHLKSFNDFIWTYRYKRVIIFKNMIKDLYIHSAIKFKLFLNFWLTIFKILYLINGKSILPNLKSESWALVSAIKWHNMTRFYMIKTHINFQKS